MYKFTIITLLRLRLVRVKVFPEKKMFSCVWLHFKKIFGKYFLMFGCILENTIENTFFTCYSHFLTFSQLPNKHIMSFIPKNSNKTQKDSIFSRWDRDRDRDRRDLDRRDRDRNLADFDDRDRRRSVRSQSREASIARSRSAQSRSWSTSIGAVSVTGEIAIVVRRCGSFRLAWCVGRSSEGLTEAVRVWETCACERGEEKL